jgi:hypothetical protein
MKEPTSPTGRIEAVQGCAYYRPAGHISLNAATELVVQAVAFARDQQVPKLLVNVLDLDFPSPSLPERYFIARKLAATAQGTVQLALVVRAHMIDPERFGVLVARNAGMNADVFSVEAEALTWLLDISGQ